MAIFDFVLIIILALAIVHLLLVLSDDRDLYLKYFGTIEKRIDKRKKVEEELAKNIVVTQHMQESDFNKYMTSMYKLSNELTRVKTRLAKLEQERIPKYENRTEDGK